MTNKYAEGYPGRRYYGGCQFVDIAEKLAIERACRLFDCRFANVQPNSGSQANQAVFMALMKPGDTFMGLDLAAGGHLTHGSPVNMSGKWFKRGAATRCARTTRPSTWTRSSALAREHKPKLIVAGGSAYSRLWDFARFREIADAVGALFHGRHRPFRRPGRGRRASLAVPARPCGHHHDPQDPARAARRHDPHQRGGHRQEGQFGDLPRPAGRAADARHRRPRRWPSARRCGRSSSSTPGPSSTTPRRLADTILVRRLRHRHRAAPTTT